MSNLPEHLFPLYVILFFACKVLTFPQGILITVSYSGSALEAIPQSFLNAAGVFPILGEHYYHLYSASEADKQLNPTSQLSERIHICWRHLCRVVRNFLRTKAKAHCTMAGGSDCMLQLG